MNSAARGPSPNRRTKEHETTTSETTRISPLEIGTAYALAALRDKAIRRQSPASS
jgi:hypothetical protein